MRIAGALAWLVLLATAATALGGTADHARNGVSSLAPASSFVPHQVLVHRRGEPTRVVHLRPGVGVREAARSLRKRPGVAYAVPNFVATASAATPRPRPLTSRSPTIPA